MDHEAEIQTICTPVNRRPPENIPIFRTFQSRVISSSIAPQTAKKHRKRTKSAISNFHRIDTNGLQLSTSRKKQGVLLRSGFHQTPFPKPVLFSNDFE
jgi:hypothetical protein